MTTTLGNVHANLIFRHHFEIGNQTRSRMQTIRTTNGWRRIQHTSLWDCVAVWSCCSLSVSSWRSPVTVVSSCSKRSSNDLICCVELACSCCSCTDLTSSNYNRHTACYITTRTAAAEAKTKAALKKIFRSRQGGADVTVHPAGPLCQ